MITPPPPPTIPSILTKIGEFFKKAIEYAPEVISFIKGVKSLFSSDKENLESATQEAYNEDAQNPSENAEVLNALNELKNNAKDKAHYLEDTLIAMLDKYVEPLIDMLEQGQISTRNIDRAMNVSEKAIRQIFTRNITQNLSIDNAKCLNILKLPGQEARKESLEHLYNETLSKALKEITSELEKSFATMQESLSEILQEKIELKQAFLQRDTALLEELQNATTQEKQKTQIFIAEQIACQNILSQMLSKLA